MIFFGRIRSKLRNAEFSSKIIKVREVLFNPSLTSFPAAAKNPSYWPSAVASVTKKDFPQNLHLKDLSPMWHPQHESFMLQQNETPSVKCGALARVMSCMSFNMVVQHTSTVKCFCTMGTFNLFYFHVRFDVTFQDFDLCKLFIAQLVFKWLSCSSSLPQHCANKIWHSHALPH
jgi:hypothetical protein